VDEETLIVSLSAFLIVKVLVVPAAAQAAGKVIEEAARQKGRQGNEKNQRRGHQGRGGSQHGRYCELLPTIAGPS